MVGYLSLTTPLGLFSVERTSSLIAKSFAITHFLLKSYKTARTKNAERIFFFSVFFVHTKTRGLLYYNTSAQNLSSEW